MVNQDNILDFSPPQQQHPRAFAATTGLRFANFIVDRIVGTGMFYGSIFVSTSITDSIENSAVGSLITLLALAIIPGYYIIFEFFWGKTPGKFITKTRVVNEEGKPPSFLNIVGRTFCRFIPFEPFSFLGGDRPTGWHDSISKTYVVEDSFVNLNSDFV